MSPRESPNKWCVESSKSIEIRTLQAYSPTFPYRSLAAIDESYKEKTVFEPGQASAKQPVRLYTRMVYPGGLTRTLRMKEIPDPVVEKVAKVGEGQSPDIQLRTDSDNYVLRQKSVQEAHVWRLYYEDGATPVTSCDVLVFS